MAAQLPGQTSSEVLDLFAGPGGWDEGARYLGIAPRGIEWDESACKTREAAGHRTLQADVSQLDPAAFSPCEGLIASPPCQSFSMAGKRGGEQDTEHVIACAHELAAGNDTRAEHRAKCEDERSMLVVEPLRYARALRPRWVALEQVPPVLGLWTMFAGLMHQWGYRTWVGVLSAERYGVPQTRKRAILLASLDFQPHPPEPTHQAYVPGEPQRHEITMFGEILPWVSMAEALGWEGTLRHSFATSGAGSWTPHELETVRPAPVVDGKARSWTTKRDDRPTHYDRRQQNDGEPVRPIPVTDPAPTLGAQGLAKGRDVWMTKRDDRPERKAAGAGNQPRPADAPAATLDTTTAQAEWTTERPAPTIVGTRRSDEGMLVGRQLPEGEGRNVGGRDWVNGWPATTISGDPRGCPEPKGRSGTDRQWNENAVRVTVQEASILQSFAPDYPWQGSRSAQFQQIGNAVPPKLACAVLRQLAQVRETQEAAA